MSQDDRFIFTKTSLQSLRLGSPKSTHIRMSSHTVQVLSAHGYDVFYYSRFWDIVLGGGRLVDISETSTYKTKSLWKAYLQCCGWILCGQTLDLSLTAATLPLSRPSFRVKARWTRTGWLAIRTTACRTTVWFVTGTPTRPERRRRWQEVRSLWALWVELVQFSSCLSLSWTCYPPSVLSVLQITVCLFWNKAVHFCFSFLHWSSYLTVSHCMLFMFCEYFGPLSLVSPFHLRYPQNYIYLHVFLCSGLFT